MKLQLSAEGVRKLIRDKLREIAPGFDQQGGTRTPEIKVTSPVRGQFAYFPLEELNVEVEVDLEVS